MKTEEEFKKYYDVNLISKLRDLENERKKLLPGAMLRLLGIGGILICFFSLNIWAFFIAIVIYMTFGVIFEPRFLKRKKELKDKYKQEIIKEIVNFIDPSLTYNSTSFISQHEFSNSKIFIRNIDRYRGRRFGCR